MTNRIKFLEQQLARAEGNQVDPIEKQDTTVQVF